MTLRVRATIYAPVRRTMRSLFTARRLRLAGAWAVTLRVYAVAYAIVRRTMRSPSLPAPAAHRIIPGGDPAGLANVLSLPRYS